MSGRFVHPGKLLRMSKIFRRASGRTVIIALDHGRRHGPIKGIEDFRSTVESLIDSGADALMMTPAMVERVADLLAGRVAVVARIDGTGSVRGPDETDDRLISSVERALSVGAAAVSVMVYVGGERNAENLEKLSRVAEEAYWLGVPVLAEVIPRPPHLPDRYSPDAVAYASRVAVELGADAIKTFFTGDGFEGVVRSVPAPIVVLGGPRKGTLLDALTEAYRAVRAGARGVAYGRNVFQFEDPRVAARALELVVHRELPPEDALDEARGTVR